MKALDRALSALVVAALAVGPSQVIAASPATSNQFAFTVNLTSTCTFDVSAAGFVVNYTSFATTPTLTDTDFQVRCTNQLPYTLSLDGGTSVTGAYTTAAGTNTGIAHTLTVKTPGSVALPSATTQTGSGSFATYHLGASVDLSAEKCTTSGGLCSDTTQHTIVASF